MRRRTAAASGLILLSMLLLGSPYARALPPADGSKCKPDWVNNPGAMDCFIQSEEDVRNGVSHPHYGACTNEGEILCCVKNNNGAENCEAVKVSGPRRPLEAVQSGGNPGRPASHPHAARANLRQGRLFSGQARGSEPQMRL